MGRTGRLVAAGLWLAACAGSDEGEGGSAARSIPTARGECEFGFKDASGAGTLGTYSFEKYGNRVVSECDTTESKPVVSDSWRCSVDDVVISAVNGALRWKVSGSDRDSAVTCSEVYVIDERGVETPARLDAVLR